jgi:hypothetical protein
MKSFKLILVLSILCFINFFSYSQSGFCGFDDVRQADLDEDSAGFVQKQAAFVAMVNRYRMLNPDPSYYSSPPPGGMSLVSSGCQEVKYLVPVVVHIIHDPGDTSTNISDAQINNAIDEMNKAFRNAASYYLPAVNTGIQFCLAKKNAFGAYISGIYRVSSTYSVHRKMDYIRLTTLSYLPPDQYVNIYVVKDIRDTSGAASNITGYATYPNRNKQYEYIVVRYDWFGNYTAKGSPLNSAARGLTLAHEMGHYLGLYHPFEKNCAGTDSSNCSKEGDLCCDVPPVNGQSSTCSNPLTNTCNETPIDKIDQKENYMDYSPESCKYLFTPDQTSLMHSVLENWRSTLISPSNINATAPNCCYISSAFEGSNFGCKNDSLTFTGIKYTDTAFYTWNIYRNDSLYRTYSDSIRYVWKLTIADTGRYDVELLVTDQAKTSTTFKKLFLTIVDCANPLQHTNANWYFGKYAGIKFRTSAVIRDIEPRKNINPYQINAEEGSLSMSNKRGQLLFYGGTDSSRGVKLRIYGKNYKQLIGSPIYGDYTANQAGVIIPYQKDTNKYHLFTVTGPNNGSSYQRYYHSVVNMSLQSTTPGEVTYKNQVMLDSLGAEIFPTNECIISIPKCQNKGHWLLCFGQTANTSYQEKLFIFKIDSTFNQDTMKYSFYKTANISSGGSNLTSMKVSPDGTLISVGTFLYLFDRSNATFKLMHSDSSLYLSEIYGSSFSPDSRKLYRIDHYNVGNLTTNPELAHQFYLYQYDPYSSDKFLSKSFIKQVNYHKQMQLGPDNKIYLSALEQNYISNIPNPNTKNTLSNQTQFNEVAVELSQNGIGGNSTLGLPNFSDALPVTQVTPTINFRPVSCKAFEFYPSECCAANFKWVFGDGDSTTSKYSTHTYGDTGNYTVILRTPGRNITRTIHVGIGSTKAKIFGDTLICDTMVNLEYSATYYDDVNYKWSGTGYKSFIIDDDRVNIKWNGTGTIKLVLINKADGCKDSTNINVNLSVIPQNNTIPETFVICDTNSTELIIGSTPTGFSGLTYKWHYQLKDSSWKIIDTATHKNFNPSKIPFKTSVIREINKGGCRHFSNPLKITILSQNNKIQLTQSPCAIDSAFIILGDTAYGDPMDSYINWQYSTNGTDWNYYNIHTQNLDKLLQNDSIYVRRLIDYTGYCEVSSNVIKIVPDVFITKQPLPKYICSFQDFTYTVEVKNQKKLPLTYWWRHFDSTSNTWSVHLATGNSFTDHAVYHTTDYIQFIIQTPCGYIYSDIVLLKVRHTGPEIDTDPSNQYINEGDRTNLIGEVFNPYETGLSYNWQYRINTKSYNGVSHSWTPKTPTWQYVSDSTRNKLQFIGGICDDSTEYRFVANNGCNSYSNPARLFMTNMADLWMRDSDNDTGAEPNSGVAGWSNPSQRTFDIFKSPDVFNCSNSPSCSSPQNAEFKKNGDNYVHFKIRNRGLQTSKPARLYLYWTLASTGELWDRHWKSTSEVAWYQNGTWSFPHHNKFNNLDSGKYFPTGGQINSTGILIQPLDTGDIFDSSYAWRPPNPRWYNTTVNGVRKTETKLQICLLARIEYCDQYPHEMEFNELYRVSVDTNVVNNNNIATHNLWVSDAVPGNTPWNNRPPRNTWTRVYQPRENPGPITLHFGDMNPVYDPSVRVIMTMDDSLHQAWVNGGLVGTGFIPLGYHRYELTSSNATFGNIYSDSALVGNIAVEFLPLDTTALPTDTSYYTLSQTLDEDGSYEGGVIFRVDFNTIINETGGGDDGGGSEPYKASIAQKDKKNKYLIYPNPANTKLTVYISSPKNKEYTILVSDLTGRTLITEICEFKQSQSCSKQIDISHLAVGTYLIRMISGDQTQVKKITILR